MLQESPVVSVIALVSQCVQAADSDTAHSALARAGSAACCSLTPSISSNIL